MTDSPSMPALPEPAPAPPASLTCTLCGGPAVVHWQRRLTDAEFADYLHAEQTRRDQIILLSDPQLPSPDLGPLPTEADCTRAVNACIHHAISQNAAALVHTKTCTAPDSAKLPACNCTPEPAPTPEPDPAPQQLPPGWS